MKLLFIFMTACLMQVSASSYAQRITLTKKNASLISIFDQINRQSGLNFLVTNELLKGAKPVDINVKDEDVREVLDKVFKNQPLNYTIEDNAVIISRKIPSFLDRVVSAFADINVTGVVVDAETGNVLVGASVKVKGSGRATTTASNGAFYLQGVDEDAIIEISFIGFKSVELKAAKNLGTIKLEVSFSDLNEVEINKGYYTETKRLSTGSVVKVSAVDIAKSPVSNVLGALQGRVSGMEITQATGIAGSGFTVRIRGQNSIANGNDPLYIIDGVSFTSAPLTNLQSASIMSSLGTNPLNYINASDISSIEVLKDADATAIYGSRGSNGVVLITTKKGKEGKTKFDINAYSGIGEVSRMIKLLNTRQYLDMRYEAYKNDGVDFKSSSVNAPDLKAWDTTRYTNWQKELIGGNAHLTNIQLALSGGNNQTNFRLGSGYQKESSVFKGDFADIKGSANVGINHKSIDQKLFAQISIIYLNDVNNLPGLDLTNQALRLSPVAPSLFTPEGKLNWQNSTWTNPVSYLLAKYKAKTNNLLGNLTIGYDILSDLRIKASLGYTSTTLKENNSNPQSAQNPAFSPISTAQFMNSSSTSWIIEPQLEYNKSIHSNKFNILIGTTFHENVTESSLQTGTGFSSDALLDNLRAAATMNQGPFDHRVYHYNAIYGRINYQFRDKYIINLTARRDGSSRFGPSKQFANFGAIGAAWIFSSEPFIQTVLPFLSYGKLRTSYGTTGNDQLNDYEFLSSYLPVTSYQGPALSPSNLYNPDFRWEINNKIEVAIDLGLCNNNFLFSASYYRNRSSNQLVGYALAPTTGFTSIQYNLPAVVQNKGLEFELNSHNIKRGGFIWDSFINLTFPNNKLLSYPNLAGSSFASRYLVGQPLSIQKLYNYKGVDPQTGLYIFQDYNTSGSITLDDKQAFVNVGQKFYGGLGNKISFSGFELNFLFQFIKQTGRNYVSVIGSQPGNTLNQPLEVLKRWQSPNDNKDFQRFSQSTTSLIQYTRYSQSTNAYSDASFIRLKNISLNYDFPITLSKKLKIQNLRLYVQGQNLLTFTEFMGLDPENNAVNSLPPLKMLTAGIQFSL